MPSLAWMCEIQGVFRQGFDQCLIHDLRQCPTCRDIIHVGSPAFTQSCLLLNQGADGLTVRHDKFPAAAMNFRALSATVLLQGFLSAHLMHTLGIV